MAATSIMLPSRLKALSLWDQFRLQADLAVRQVNEAAGKALLVSRSYGPFVHQLSIESASRSTHRIECSFDLDRGVLDCRPGPALKIDPFQFRWLERTPDILQLHGEEHTLNGAVSFVLNRLTHL